jgi:arylsulfatase A-like enzyme
VSILWFSDPDKTSHYRGIGSPDNRAAIQAADAQVGRILDWMQQTPTAEQLNLFVLSDHGHITVREQISVCHALSAAGFPAAPGHFGAGDIAVVPGATGSIHLRHRDTRLVHTIAHWLQAQPWCGAVFTAAKNAVEGIVPGTLARTLALNEHPRTGDIVYVMRADEAQDAYGIVGGGYDDSALSIGGGTHGGLSPYELHNVGVAYGPAFGTGITSVLPSGTIDIMPTLLHLLGYGMPAGVEGRVLYEALAQMSAAPESAAVCQTYSAEVNTPSGLYRQHLATSRVGTTTYLDRAWVD